MRVCLFLGAAAVLNRKSSSHPLTLISSPSPLILQLHLLTRDR
jgi:hypothetical protein